MALDRNAAKAIVAAYYANRDGTTPGDTRDFEDLVFRILDGIRTSAVVLPSGSPAMAVGGSAVTGQGRLA
ncbi:MAG: hypothetical protein JWP97_5407 [Labilithrix sp.]|nr:hypothetical protein [Labilithrix sp.]